MFCYFFRNIFDPCLVKSMNMELMIMEGQLLIFDHRAHKWPHPFLPLKIQALKISHPGLFSLSVSLAVSLYLSLSLLSCAEQGFQFPHLSHWTNDWIFRCWWENIFLASRSSHLLCPLQNTLLAPSLLGLAPTHLSQPYLKFPSIKKSSLRVTLRLRLNPFLIYSSSISYLRHLLL